MIRFNTIHIQSYKAIEDLLLILDAGIIKVVGVNNDDHYDSNGSGKTTALQAISFALFNRDFNNAPLGSLGNRITGKAPAVTINLTNTITKKTYNVLNDKQNKVYTISEEIDVAFEVIASGLTEVQKEINSILGMTYNTFKLTHFITSSTINAIAENLSQPVVFNDLLQVVEYQGLEKLISEVNKEVTEEIKYINSKLEEATKAEELLKISSRFDKNNLEETLALLEKEEIELTEKYSVLVSKIKPKITSLTELVSIGKKEAGDTTKTLSEGTCKACGTYLTDEETLDKLEQYLVEVKEHLKVNQEELDKLIASNRTIEMKYTVDKAKVVEKIQKVNTELQIAEEVEKLSKNSSTDNIESSSSLESKLKELKALAAYYTQARKEIKSGNIIQELMDSFFSIVEARMLEYATILNLESFNIRLSSNNLGMQIGITQQVKKKEVIVPIETLSNGEKTRLSLLILISMLDAMKVVSDCETNYLVFDEASSSFDKSGVEELSLLFSHLKNLGQSCFIITHGTEMDKVNFDYELILTKTGGKSTGIINKL